MENKFLALIVLTFFALTNINAQTTSKLTKLQEKKINAEISKAMEVQLKSGKTDVDAIIKGFWNSPELTVISTEGKVENYEQFTVELRNALTGTTQDIKTTFQKIKILSQDLVLTTWQGDDVLTFPDNTKFELKGMSWTVLFKKIGTEWKIAYSHESIAPPPPEQTK